MRLRINKRGLSLAVWGVVLLCGSATVFGQDEAPATQPAEDPIAKLLRIRDEEARKAREAEQAAEAADPNAASTTPAPTSLPTVEELRAQERARRAAQPTTMPGGVTESVPEGFVGPPMHLSRVYRRPEPRTPTTETPTSAPLQEPTTRANSDEERARNMARLREQALRSAQERERSGEHSATSPVENEGSEEPSNVDSAEHAEHEPTPELERRPVDPNENWFAFDNTPWEDVIELFRARIGKPLMSAPEDMPVGTLTYKSDRVFTKDEAIDELNLIMYEQGYRFVEQEHHVRIIPINEMKEWVSLAKVFPSVEAFEAANPRDMDYVIVYYQVKDVPAKLYSEMFIDALPFEASISAIVESNQIKIAALARDVRRFLALKDMVDITPSDPRQLKFFKIETNARQIEQLVRNFLDLGGGQGNMPRMTMQRDPRTGRMMPVPVQQPQGGDQMAVQMIADDRTNSIIVKATADKMAEIERLIKEFDKKPDLVFETKNYPLTYADAAEIANLLNQIFSSEQRQNQGNNAAAQRALAIQQARLRAMQAQQRRGGNQQPQPNIPQPQEIGMTAPDDIISEGIFEQAKKYVRIVADPRQNLLFVYATKEGHDRVAEMLKELDQPLPDNYKTFTVHNTPIEEIAPLITELSSNLSQSVVRGRQAPQIVTDANKSVFHVIAERDDMQRIESLIQQLDVAGPEQKKHVLQLTKKRPSEMVPLIQSLLDADRSTTNSTPTQFPRRPGRFGGRFPMPTNTSPTVTATKTYQLIPLDDAQLLIVFCTDEDWVKVDEMITGYEEKAVSSTPVLREYPVENGDPQRIAETLTNLYRAYEHPVLGRSQVLIQPDEKELFVYAVEPAQEEIAGLLVTLDVPRQDDEIVILPLAYADAMQVATQLQQMMQRGRGGMRGGTGPLISAEATTNALIVQAGAADLERIKTFADELDKKFADQETQKQFFTVKNINPREAASAVQQMFTGGGRMRGMAAGQQIKAVATDSQVVVEAPADKLKEIAAFITQLDDPQGKEIVIKTLKMEPGVDVAQVASKLMNAYRMKQNARVMFDADATAETIMLTCPRDELEEALRLVNEYADVQKGQRMVVEFREMKYSQATEAATWLRDQLMTSLQPLLGRNAQQLIKVTADTRTNRVIINGPEVAVTQGKLLLNQYDVEPTNAPVPPIINDVRKLAGMDVQELARNLNQTFSAQPPRPDRLKAEFGADPTTETLIIAAPKDMFEEINRLIGKFEAEAAELVLERDFIQVTQADANYVAQQLRDLLTTQFGRTRGRGVTDRINVTVDSRQNQIILNVPKLVMPAAKDLIARLDQPPTAGSQITTIPLANADASAVYNTLRGLSMFAEKLTAKTLSLSPEPITNTLIVGGSKADIEEIQTWALKFDEDAAAADFEPVIIEPKHADLNELKGVVEAMFRVGGKAGRNQQRDVTVTVTNGQLVVKAPKKSLAAIRSLVEEIDQPNPAGEMDIKMFDLKVLNAIQVSAAVQLFLKSARTNNRAGGLSPGAYPEPTTNTLVVIAPQDTMPMIELLVNSLEAKAPDAAVSRSYTLTNVRAEQVANNVDAMLKAKVMEREGSRQARGQTAVFADATSNRLIVFAPQTYHTLVDELIKIVDAESTGGEIVHIVPIAEADAQALAQSLNGALTGRGGAPMVRISPDAASNSVIIAGLPKDVAQAEQYLNQLAENSSDVPELQIVQPSFVSAEQVNDILTARFGKPKSPRDAVVVTLDDYSNRLYVTANKRQMRIVEGIVAQLDQDPSEHGGALAGRELYFVDINRGSASDISWDVRDVLDEMYGDSPAAPKIESDWFGEYIRVMCLPTQFAQVERLIREFEARTKEERKVATIKPHGVDFDRLVNYLNERGEKIDVVNIPAPKEPESLVEFLREEDDVPPNYTKPKESERSTPPAAPPAHDQPGRARPRRSEPAPTGTQRPASYRPVKSAEPTTATLLAMRDGWFERIERDVYNLPGEAAIERSIMPLARDAEADSPFRLASFEEEEPAETPAPAAPVARPRTVTTPATESAPRVAQATPPATPDPAPRTPTTPAAATPATTAPSAATAGRSVPSPLEEQRVRVLRQPDGTIVLDGPEDAVNDVEKAVEQLAQDLAEGEVIRIFQFRYGDVSAAAEVLSIMFDVQSRQPIIIQQPQQQQPQRRGGRPGEDNQGRDDQQGGPGNFMQQFQRMTGAQRGGTGQQRGGTALRIATDPGHNYLIIKCDAADLPEIRKLLRELDIPPGEVQVKVIKLKHLTAEETATTIKEALGISKVQERRGGAGGRQSRAGGAGPQQQLMEMLQQQQVSIAGVEGGAKVERVEIVPNATTNSLLVSSPPEVMALIERVINELEELGFTAAETYICRFGDAEQIAAVLAEIFGGSGGGGGPRGEGRGGSAAAETRIVGDSATNTITVWATEEQRALVFEKAKQLDELANRGIREIDVVYAKADELAATLNEVFGSGSTTGASRPGGRRRGGGGGDGPQVMVGGSGRVMIIGDKDSKKILVRAPDDLFVQIEELAEKLDQPSQDLLVKKFELKHADANVVVQSVEEALAKYLQVDRLSGDSGGSKFDAFTVMPDPRTNSVVVVGTEQTFLFVGKILAQIDVETPVDQRKQFRLYPLKEANPALVADAINALATSQSPTSGRGGAGVAKELNVTAVADPASKLVAVFGKLEDIEYVATNVIAEFESAINRKLASIPVHNVPPSQIVSFVLQFMDAGGQGGANAGADALQIVPNDSGKNLIVRGTLQQLEEIERLVGQFDNPDIVAGQIEVVEIPTGQDAARLASEVERIVNESEATLADQTGRAAQQLTVGFDDYTNTIILAGPQALFGKAKSIIDQLGNVRSTAMRTRIIQVGNGLSADTAVQMIRELQDNRAGGGSSGRTPGTSGGTRRGSGSSRRSSTPSSGGSSGFRPSGGFSPPSGGSFSPPSGGNSAPRPSSPNRPQGRRPGSGRSRQGAPGGGGGSPGQGALPSQTLPVSPALQEYVAPASLVTPCVTSITLSPTVTWVAWQYWGLAARHNAAVAEQAAPDEAVVAESSDAGFVRLVADEATTQPRNVRRVIRPKNAAAASTQSAQGGTEAAAAEEPAPPRRTPRARRVEPNEPVPAPVTPRLRERAALEEELSGQTPPAPPPTPAHVPAPVAQAAPPATEPAADGDSETIESVTGVSGTLRGEVIAQPLDSQQIIVTGAEDDLDFIEQVLRMMELTASPAIIDVIPLEHAKASAIAPIIEKVMQAQIDIRTQQPGPQDKFSVSAENRSNSLIIAAAERMMPEIKKIIEGLDKKTTGGGTDVRQIVLENVRAVEAVALLKPTIDKLMEAREIPAESRVTVSAVERNNSVLLVGTEQDLAEIGEMFKNIDVKLTEDKGSTNFVTADVVLIQLQNGRAEDVAKVLTDMINEQQENARNAKPDTPGAPFVKVLRLRMPDGRELPPLNLDRPIKIVAEKGTNSLIIFSSKENNEALQAIVGVFDTLPIGADTDVKAFALQHAPADQIAQLVQQLFDDKKYLSRPVDGQSGVPSGVLPPVPPGVAAQGLPYSIVVQADVRSNTVVVIGRTDAVLLAGGLIRELDRPTVDLGMKAHVIALKTLSATQAAEKLNKVLDERTAALGGKNEARDSAVVEPEERSNALLVFATDDVYKMIDDLVTELDAAEKYGTVDVRYRNLKQADAAKMQSMLTEMFDAKISAEKAANPQSQDAIKIIADTRSNSLLMTGTRDYLQEAERLLTDLDRPFDGTVVFRAVKVKLNSAANIASLLQEMVDKALAQQDSALKGTPIHIAADPVSDSLLLAAAREDMNLLERWVEILDRPSEIGRMVTIIPLRQRKAEDVSKAAESIFQQQSGGTGGGKVDLRVTSDVSTNSVVAFGPPALIKDVEDFVHQFDATEPINGVIVRMFKLEKANAEDAGDLLTRLLELQGGSVGGTGGGSSGGGGTNEQDAQLLLVWQQQHPELGQETFKALRKNIRVLADVRTNTLFVTAPPEGMPLMEAMVHAVDTPPDAAKIRVFALRNADAEQMITLLQEVFQRQNTQTSGGRNTGSNAESQRELTLGTGAIGGREEISFSADVRTNSVIATGTAGYLDLVEQIILQLDTQPIEERVTFVYSPRNNTAQAIAESLQSFSDKQTQRLQEIGNDVSKQVQMEREILVIPNEEANRVIIDVDPRFKDTVMRVVEQLDEIPPQVVIQVLILEVTVDNALDLGVEFAFQDLQYSKAGPTDTTTFDYVGGTDIGAAGSGLGGFTFTITGADFNFLFRTLQSEGNLRVLSRPQITAMDNQEAVIEVANDVPYVSGTQTSTTGQISTSVSRADVGITLTVTPQINPDGYVRMEVEQEVSDQTGSSVAVAQGVNSPIFFKRRAQTTIMVRDSETVVLGGLITSREENRENKVPILGDVPGLGTLFRAQTDNMTRTELLVVMTPHVVRTAEDFRDISVVERDRLGLVSKEALRDPLMQGLQIKDAPVEDGSEWVEPGEVPVTPAQPATPATSEPAAPQAAPVGRPPNQGVYGPTRPARYEPAAAPQQDGTYTVIGPRKHRR